MYTTGNGHARGLGDLRFFRTAGPTNVQSLFEDVFVALFLSLALEANDIAVLKFGRFQCLLRLQALDHYWFDFLHRVKNIVLAHFNPYANIG
jgi:hypothetical protein